MMRIKWIKSMSVVPWVQSHSSKSLIAVIIRISTIIIAKTGWAGQNLVEGLTVVKDAAIVDDLIEYVVKDDAIVKVEEAIIDDVFEYVVEAAAIKTIW